MPNEMMQDPSAEVPQEQDPMAGISFPMGDSAPSPDAPQAEPENPEQSEQYKQDLQEMIAAVQAKVDEHSSEAEAGNTELKAQRDALIEKVFSLMVSEGVDLNNPAAIQKFLAEMEQKDPQRYQAFTALLEKIMDPEEEEPVPEGEMPGGEMPAEPAPEMPGSAPLDLSQVPAEG